MKKTKRYYSPTPLKWRKLGDALLATSITVTTFAIAEDYKIIAIVACILGGLGKFLSNFFTDDVAEKDTIGNGNESNI